MDQPAGGALLLLAIAAVFYFAPAIVAIGRGHRNATSILVLNLLLGWTFIGWVIAIVWAFSYQAHRDRNNRIDERHNTIFVDRR